MKRLFNERTAVKVYCDVQEMAVWLEKATAENVSVSEWVRRRCNNGAEPRRAAGCAGKGVQVNRRKAERKADHTLVPPIPLIASNGSTLGQQPSAEMPTATTFSGVHGICGWEFNGMVCGHPKHKHHGFNGACQDDRCHCPGYVG